MTNVTITLTEIVDGVSAASTPQSITVYDGVFVDTGGTGGGAVSSVNSKTGAVVLSASDVGAQPVDSDLTAIAALTTTTFGRGLLTAADAAAARALTGAGTSNLALGTTSSTAKAGDYQPAAANISDASTIGRTVLTAASAAAIRTAIGAGTSSFDGTYASLTGKPTLGTAAAAATGDFDAAGAAAAAQAASQPLDSDLTAIAALATTTFGRSLLTAADAAAARGLIGAGTSSFDGAYSSLTGKPTIPSTVGDISGAAPLASPTLTGNPTAPTPTAGDNDTSIATTAFVTTAVAAVGGSTKTINAQTGTSYTLVLTDAGKFVTMTNAAASTLTVPPNSSVAFPVGTVIEGAELGAGQVTLTPGSGVTINGSPGLKVAAQYGTFGLLKTATDTWLAYGRLSA